MDGRGEWPSQLDWEADLCMLPPVLLVCEGDLNMVEMSSLLLSTATRKARSKEREASLLTGQREQKARAKMGRRYI